MDPIERSLFVSRMSAVCREMGAVLQRSAFSPNIQDRLDFSCAVFNAAGELCAQAAHIPVHLGSMAYAMRMLVSQCDWQDGDMMIVNDPYLGGTHLPDVTLIAPVFAAGRLAGFVANRAHYADIGSETPGSMPLARRLEEEGLIIPPTLLVRAGAVQDGVLDRIRAAVRSPAGVSADVMAQLSANRRGAALLQTLVAPLGTERFAEALDELNDYAERLAATGIAAIPEGDYRFEDVMEDDGTGSTDLPIHVRLSVRGRRVRVDFSGTAPQAAGNINCPLSVTAAAVGYCFYALAPAETPPCAGAFRPIHIEAPAGCLVNARAPAAVAAGNVETSSRIVDVVLGALARALPDRIPAASHGSMNNLAMGGTDWDYYETLGGGAGAGAAGAGRDAVQTHMTNTRNTPVEVLELRYPLRVAGYRIRRGSGGGGRHRGGDGLVRSIEFLAPAAVTLLTERRRRAPWGLNGGAAGARGGNRLRGIPVPGKTAFRVGPGDVLDIETAGGGGWGGLSTLPR